MQAQISKTINKTQSLSLIQNIILSSIGCVSYVRGLFPESSFETKGLDGIAVKCLKREESTEGNSLLEWLEQGCFDALEKQYLKTLVFGIYLDREKPNEFVESYEFNFDYPSKDDYNVNVVIKEPSRQELSKTTHQIVRRLLVLTQSFEPLPEHAYVTMRLYYTDDTPIEYEPPSFKPCNLDIPLDLQPVKIGDIETQHHQMSCSVKSLCDVATTTAPQSGSETDVDVEMAPAPVVESTQELQHKLGPLSLEPTQPCEKPTMEPRAIQMANSERNNQLFSDQLEKAKQVIVCQETQVANTLPYSPFLVDDVIEGTQYPPASQSLTQSLPAPGPHDDGCTMDQDSGGPLEFDTVATAPTWVCVCGLHELPDPFSEAIVCNNCHGHCHASCFGASEPGSLFLCHGCSKMSTDLLLIAMYRRACLVLSPTRPLRSQIVLARLVTGNDQSSSNIAPSLFSFFVSHGVLSRCLKRNGKGYQKTYEWRCDPVALQSIRELLFNPMSSFKLLTELFVKDSQSASSNDSPSSSNQKLVQEPKRRKVSTVAYDLAVL